MSPEAQKESDREKRGILRRIIKDAGSGTPDLPGKFLGILEEGVLSDASGELSTGDIVWSEKVGYGDIFIGACPIVGSTSNVHASFNDAAWGEYFRFYRDEFKLQLPSSSECTSVVLIGTTADIFPRILLVDYERKISELNRELDRYKAAADTKIQAVDTGEEITPSAPLNAASGRVLDFIASVRIPDSSSTLIDFSEEDS